ncbi:hypothetical protein AKJ63_01885 [candidate division MSBL1 archaeon SCGC-AAA259D18]|uniref:Uncharacterized protein n=1 Tax=candidate division MSBL1 archaeon SCGC-AAA259D18 TaxID=1698262 RepID=A0A133UA86_9EURY|nr:hypothetical protein AKJ63_01885 [candidate division MSBL1 archaeon SCGC-AAA259D18]
MVAGVVVVVLEGLDEVTDCFEPFCLGVIAEALQPVFQSFGPSFDVVSLSSNDDQIYVFPCLPAPER